MIEYPLKDITRFEQKNFVFFGENLPYSAQENNLIAFDYF